MLEITRNMENETENPIMSLCQLISILLLNTWYSSDYMFSKEVLQNFKKYCKGESVTEMNNNFCTREEKKDKDFPCLEKTW